MPLACSHTTLNFGSSTHADEVGYCRPSAQQRATAAGKRKQDTKTELEGTFPAPLVLPGDDLSFDTRCPPQSLLSWVREKERNKVRPERNVVYVAAPPAIAPEVKFVHAWSVPQPKGGGASAKSVVAPPPITGLLLQYLKAFYHGLNVEALPAGLLQFTRWDDADPNSTRYIGLTTSTETLGIRTRPSKDGIFKGQINLDDLLDTAMSILPSDAYALLMLVEHDLFEDEDDDFCCGESCLRIKYGGNETMSAAARCGSGASRRVSHPSCLLSSLSDAMLTPPACRACLWRQQSSRRLHI